MTDTRAELIARITSGSGSDAELNEMVWKFITPHSVKHMEDTVTGGGNFIEVDGQWLCWEENLWSHVPKYSNSLDAIAAIPGANIVKSETLLAYNTAAEWLASHLSSGSEIFKAKAFTRPRAELAAVLSDPTVGGE